MRVHLHPGAGWLLPVLLLMIAAGPAAAQEDGPVWFEDVAARVGLDFVHQSGMRPERPYFPEIVPGGGALFDLDGDDDLDVYLVQSGSLWEPRSEAARNRLYRNRGDGTFDDVTDGSGADDLSYGMGVVTGDYDNDGDPDLYVTNYGPNILLRNDGDLRFTDVTREAGVGDSAWGMSGSFSDFDADGDLDLFVTNYVTWTIETEIDCFDAAGALGYCVPTHYESPSRDTLYRNDGDGTFTDMSEIAGMQTSFGNGLGVFCADMTGDGRTDIFVSNDTVLDHLWINEGDFRFTEDALIRGCACDEDGFAKAGMGVAVVDWDEDGDRDFLVVNFAHEADSFYDNDGMGYFFDRSISIGLGFKTKRFTRFGVGFRDFDNDGRMDLYFANGRATVPVDVPEAGNPFGEMNLLFTGSPDGTLHEVFPRGGAAPAVFTSRGAVFGDFDDDGALDVMVVNRDGPVQLLKNVVKDRGHWIGFRVRERSGSDALGAVVTMEIGERKIQRDVISAESYLAANDPRVHVGLGPAETVTGVRVRWSDGQVETFGEFGADAYHELVRGRGASP